MYHPTRGGVRGGRDQFKWDDVKVDKHRENYLGHSVKAPVGRWQKGKDLNWYARDKNSQLADMEAAKTEIQRIKEEEEQAMREALGLAPKRASRPQGNRIDKYEYSELVKRESTAEDVGAGHAEAARLQGLGFARAPNNYEESTSLPAPEKLNPMMPKLPPPPPGPPPPGQPRNTGENSSDDEKNRKKPMREERKQEKREKYHSRGSSDSSDDESRRKKRKREEKKQEKREKRHSRDSCGTRNYERHDSEDRRTYDRRDSDEKMSYGKRDKHRSLDSNDKKRHRKHKETRRHDSD